MPGGLSLPVCAGQLLHLCRVPSLYSPGLDGVAAQKDVELYRWFTRFGKLRSSRHTKQPHSNDFQVRQAAQKQLARNIRWASPELREAANNPPSAEVGKQAETLLASADLTILETEEKLQLRAIVALEFVNTKPARQLLETMTKGESLSLVTQNAVSALKRMEAASRP